MSTGSVRTRWQLPLLEKELIEMSARPRTYFIRVLYAAILCIISFCVLVVVIANAASPLTVLGSGQYVLIWLNVLQALGIHLLLPPIACGAISREKERNTLGLLFLTRLGPWQILGEKLLSCVIPALCLLVISAPVLAFCYALGGTTIPAILTQFTQSLLSALMVISVSLMCSAFCRTSTGALLSTYLVIYLASVATAFVMQVLMLGSIRIGIEILVFTLVTGGLLNAYWFYAGMAGLNTWWVQLVPFVVPIVVSATSVLLARLCLVRRAFLPTRNHLQVVFEATDRWLELLNRNSLTRGVRWGSNAPTLPAEQPVAWRETQKRSLCQVRYLVRILIVIEAPVLLGFALLINNRSTDDIMAATILVQVVGWTILTLVISTLSATMISGERTRQTLDVLLATPIRGEQIIHEKMAGLRRLIWVLEAPLWTAVFARMLLDEFRLDYLAIHASMLLVYPRQLAWIGMYYGIRSKTALRAVVTTLAYVFVSCVVPLLIVLVGVTLFDDSFVRDSHFLIIGYLSPLMAFGVGEAAFDDSIYEFAPLMVWPVVGAVVNTCIHLAHLQLMARSTLRNADRFLGRTGKVAVRTLPAQPLPDPAR